jgi:hypothetical protein
MPSMPVAAMAPVPTSPNRNPLAAAVEAQIADLGRAQREFIDRQAVLHRQFLAVHERSVATLAASQRCTTPDSASRRRSADADARSSQNRARGTDTSARSRT